MASVRRPVLTSIAKRLEESVTAGDDHQQRYLLSRILSHALEGEDCSRVLARIVKLLAHSDICIKKMAGEILIYHSAGNAEMVLLAINTLTQDTQDSSPLIRGLALKTLSLLQQDTVSEHLERIIIKALTDQSAYVRRIAVFSCLKLHAISPSAIKENDLIDTLYGMIRDDDPFVVVNCLCTLEEILQEEGGIVINRAIADYLLNRLDTFPTWSLLQVVNILKKYRPANHNDIFVVLNRLDHCFENNSPAVVAGCVDLFVHFLHQSLPHLHPEVFKQTKSSLIGLLSKGNLEITSSIIDIIAEAPKEALTHFCQSFKSFFCNNKDPPYLKLKKIDLLSKLTTDNNGEAILEHLNLCSVSETKSVSLGGIQAIGRLHQQRSSMSNSCVKKFSSLMQSSSVHIKSNLFQVLQGMEIKDKDFWAQLIRPLCEDFHAITDIPGKSAALFLIGEHLQHSAEAFAVIEECEEKFSDLEHSDVKCQLLTATTKMFFAHPLELQPVLGCVFEAALADPDFEVNDRAMFLYELLESGVENAKIVLLKGYAAKSSQQALS